VRVDVLGVTSIVRALNLRPRLYTKLLDHFHSSGIKLDRLSALWARAVYYAAGKMVSGLLKQGNHLVTRVKSNAVAYAPAPSKRGRRTRGRPRTYGKKIKLKSLLANVKSMQRVASPVYGERNVTLRYRIRDLLWRPARRLVRFVVVVHPTRGSCILMCTDTSLSAVDIVRLYGLRFKIEHSFKQATRQIGSFAYHFWMKDTVPLRYHNGNQYLHRKSADYRSRVKRKMCAYHAFTQAGVVAQGLLQYLAVVAPKLVWDYFGSWLRTIRPGIPPSEFVVANALRQSLPDFLLGPAKSDSLTKFIVDRQDTQNMRIFRLAG
jgi:DDE superfamily endonuclease